MKINFKYVFLSKLVNLQSEKIHSYKVRAFDYATIRLLYEEIFYKNEYFFKCNDTAPTVIDCGANLGMATIYFKWLYPKCRIYSFEPDPRTFDILEKNIQTNKITDVQLVNKILSNDNRPTEFYVDPQRPGSLIMSTKSGRLSKSMIMVDSIKLSSFIKKNHITTIDLVKMDIEGSEGEVINDLSENDCLSRIDKLIIEYHHNIEGSNSSLAELIDVFETHNYGLQLETHCFPLSAENRFQDVVFYFYKSV